MKIESGNKIITTADGSSTIYVPDLKDHYHSINGAIIESETVFIKPGLALVESESIKIFEVGFGTGLNALLTAVEAEKQEKMVYYSAIEKYPLGLETIRKLNYTDFIPGTEIFDSIHSCSWDKYVTISEFFQINKIEADMAEYVLQGKYDIIYFDAFGPDKQAEMWSDEIIEKIGQACNPGALFLTYSAKGKLKRQLIASGFKVEHNQGPPGKREITRAVKI